MTVEDLLQLAMALSRREQEELAKSLIDLLAADDQTPKRRLSELQGLGKEFWQDVDAKTYIDEQRNEWGETS